MADCKQIRPLLYSLIEQEAEPAEAIEVASHLANCTACKILLARKRRLARMLEEGLEDSLPVGDEFVRSVMATLPEGPPPEDRKTGRNRGFKLAGFAGLLLALGQDAAARLPMGGLERPALALPNVDLPAGDGAYQGVLDLIRWAVLAFETLAGRIPIEVALPSLGTAFLAATAVAAGVALLGSSAAIAMAAGSYVRSRRF
jgi:predicted anti-sigma-YlaC factor YlaD